MCVAGVLGAWTLPQVAIGFLATGAVLLLRRELRWPTLVGLVASVLAIYVWYSPHTAEVHAAAVYPDGRKISTAWLVTAPFDQILSPAFLWIEGVVVVPGALSLAPRGRRGRPHGREPARAQARPGAHPHGRPRGRGRSPLGRSGLRHPALSELPPRAAARAPRERHGRDLRPRSETQGDAARAPVRSSSSSRSRPTSSTSRPTSCGCRRRRCETQRTP